VSPRQRERRLAIRIMATAAATPTIMSTALVTRTPPTFLPPGPVADLACFFADVDEVEVVVFTVIAFMSGRIMVLHRLQVLDGRSPAARGWPQPAAMPESVVSPRPWTDNLAVRILDGTLCDHEDISPRVIYEVHDLPYSGLSTVYRRSA
jgi:hypothetical protein